MSLRRSVKSKKVKRGHPYLSSPLASYHHLLIFFSKINVNSGELKGLTLRIGNKYTTSKRLGYFTHKCDVGGEPCESDKADAEFTS